VGVNSCLVASLQEEQRLGKGFVLAVDASFIHKSGKATPELGKYWDSKQGKAVKGLEVSCCALIDPERKYALPLDVKQTPASLQEGKTRLDHYAKHVSDVLECVPVSLNAQIAYVVGDAYYSKKAFVDKVVQAGRHVVGKLRCDANLKYLYQGKPTGKAGRPRKFAGKVDFKDFSRWQEVTYTDSLRIYFQCLYHGGLQRTVQVVCVVRHSKGKEGKPKEKRDLFFSTDTQQHPQDILDINQVRFQIEFCFRDTKQFSGLLDCQARHTEAIDFHWNMAFLVMNLAKAQQRLCSPRNIETFTFSMEDAKCRAYNEFFAEKIFTFLPFPETFTNFKNRFNSLLDLGVKAA
jgi:putative transposase